MRREVLFVQKKCLSFLQRGLDLPLRSPKSHVNWRTQPEGPLLVLSQSLHRSWGTAAWLAPEDSLTCDVEPAARLRWASWCKWLRVQKAKDASYSPCCSQGLYTEGGTVGADAQAHSSRPRVPETLGLKSMRIHGLFPQNSKSAGL